jgi:hypothetical protein
VSGKSVTITLVDADVGFDMRIAYLDGRGEPTNQDPASVSHATAALFPGWLASFAQAQGPAVHVRLDGTLYTDETVPPVPQAPALAG